MNATLGDLADGRVGNTRRSERDGTDLGDPEANLTTSRVIASGAKAQVQEFRGREAALSAGETKMKADQATPAASYLMNAIGNVAPR